MSLELEIKKIIETKLTDGTIEQMISEAFTKAIQNATNDIFSNYSGNGTKAIKTKLEEILIPAIEKYDFNNYLIKLDSILAEIVNSYVVSENKKLLENFKFLTKNKDVPTEIKLSELFEIYGHYIETEIDVSNLQPNEDDPRYYESVSISAEVTYDEVPSWSSFEYGKIIFSCEEDEEQSFMINISKWNGTSYKNYEQNWSIKFDTPATLSSIRYLNDFELFLLQLQQEHTKIIIDENYINESIIPDQMTGEN